MGPANTRLTTGGALAAVVVLALAPATALAAGSSKTSTTTTSLLLPSVTTSANEHIYATLISGSEEKDVYSLDCQPDFGASRTCSGAFAGHTLTYGPATVRLDLGPTGAVHDCARGKPGDVEGDMQCRASGGGGTFTATATLDERARVTPVTVLGATGKAKGRKTTRTITTDGRTVTTTVPAETGSSAKPTSGGGACKRDLLPRKVGHSGSGGDGADAAGSAGGAGTTRPDDDEGAEGTTTGGSRRNGAGGCSAGSRVEGVEWVGALLGLGVLGLAFAV